MTGYVTQWTRYGQTSCVACHCLKMHLWWSGHYFTDSNRRYISAQLVLHNRTCCRQAHAYRCHVCQSDSGYLIFDGCHEAFYCVVYNQLFCQNCWRISIGSRSQPRSGGGSRVLESLESTQCLQFSRSLYVKEQEKCT